jgi:hypothetical protein
MGIRITGYYKDRFAEGVLDNIYTVALALAVEDKKVLFITVDNCGIKQSVVNEFRTFVSEKTGVPFEGIYVHSTHTHTGPKVWPECDNEVERIYKETVKLKMADAAILAIQDLKDAKMGTGVSVAPNISFVRRFRMKDGSVKTNPGVNNPDIVAPIGDIDDTVNVIRFAREDAEDIVQDVKEAVEKAEEAKEAAEDTAEEVVEKAEDVAEEAAEKAEDVAEEVKDAVEDN